MKAAGAVAAKKTGRRQPSAAKPVHAAPRLAALQEQFQLALMQGDTGVLEHILEAHKEDRAVLLGVYQHAYAGRLCDILRSDYPVLTDWAGADAINEHGRAYVNAAPSRHANARWFGQRFPEFLAANAGPALAELAALERALNDMFDAAEQPSLQLSDLAQVAPEDWPRVVFSPHAVTRRLTFASNAAVAWRAHNADAALPAAAELDEPEQLIVYRSDLTPRFRPMDYAEAMLWDEMVKGMPFGALCEMLAAQTGNDDAALHAASTLKGWIDEGLLAAPEE